MKSLHLRNRYFTFLLIVIAQNCTFTSTIIAGNNDELLTQETTETTKDSGLPKPTKPKRPPAAAITHTAEEAEQLNKLYATWKTELDMLSSGVQHIAQLIATNKIRPSDTDAAHFWLQSFNTLLNKAAKLPYAPLTPHKLIHFFTFNKTLIQAFNNAVKNNFTTYEDFEELEQTLNSLSITIQSTKKTSVPLATITEYAQETSQAVQILLNKINKSGLTWYNNAYRKLLSADRQWHLSGLTKTALVGAALTSFYMMIASKSDQFANVPLLGAWQGKVNAFTDTVAPYATPGRDEYFKIMLATSIGNLTLAAYNAGAFTKLGQWVADLDAFLKGSTNEASPRVVQFVENFSLDDPMFDCLRPLFGPFEDILAFLEDPDLYLGTGIKVPKCVLLMGSPGSGKTHSARAFAGSITQLFNRLGRFERAGFLEVEPWDLGQIEEVIKQAKANAPCVIFIDEIHLFGGGAQINSNAMFLSKLLTEIDKIDRANDPTQQIFVVAATNRPDLLAKALLRHGRFGLDGRIEFPVPDFSQRLSVFKALCKRSAIDTSAIDLDKLARLTQGSSFSAISKIFDKAGFIAKQQATGITHEHLYEALNKTLRIFNPHMGLNDHEQDIVATHVAGLALAHLMLDAPVQLDAVTIQKAARKVNEQLEFVAKMENQDEDKQHTSHYGAFYTYTDNEHITQESTDSLVACKLLVAGNMAQKVMLGKKSTYGQEERQQALEVAEKICLDGLKADKLGKTNEDLFKQEALKTLVACEADVEKLLRENKDKISLIAHELKKKLFLTAQDIKQLLAAHEQKIAPVPLESLDIASTEQ